ncbi:MAG: 6-phosphofructokinase [Acidobacteria bacterium]|nr:MAG: 6-phosphofructokinase [Acidobacteriota bacterium]
MAECKSSIKKIAILTGGGDCPGLNAVIRGVVKTAIRKYNWRVYGVPDGFEGMVTGSSLVELTEFGIRGILPRGGTILGTTNRGNPFEYVVVEDGKEVIRDMSDQVVENLRILEIDALVVIGGDGTLGIADKFTEKGICIVGVPKTIDNDLQATDYTFGFNTAITTATEALDKLHTTAQSHHRVIVVELMGRYAGWIALESGLAGGADVILIPEIEYDIEKVCSKIIRRSRTGSKFSIVVVAEGSRPVGGKMIFQERGIRGRSPRLGGVGNVVGAQIEERTKMDVRVTVLGHLQRGGSPTPFDRILATRFGVAAADCLASGKCAHMVCLKTPKIRIVPIKEAVASLKNVDPDGQLVKAAESIGISLGR